MIRVPSTPLLALAALLGFSALSARDAGSDAPAPVNPPSGKAEPVDSPAADSPERLRSLVDSLDQASLQEAFRLLTSDYLNHEDLDALEVNRAAFQGMLDRLDFGAMLLTEEERSNRNSPFRFFSGTVNDHIAYLRFGRFNESELAQLDSALTEFSADPDLENLIVDLRSPQAQADFRIASEILSRFRPPNELLFKIRRPGNERATLFVSQAAQSNWGRNLILLVDQETGNVGEIIAALLKREAGCLLIGETTPGLTVEYRDVPIGEDRILRYAIAEVVLEDNTSLFRKGISPDIENATPLKTKQAVFRALEKEDTTLADLIYLKQRPRMNEAALVAGTDPEIDYFLLRSSNKPTPWDEAPLQDRAFRQAVDLLDTTRFLDTERRNRR